MKSILIFCLSLISCSIFSQSLYDVNSITQIDLSFFETYWDDTLTYYKVNNLDQRLVATAVINGVTYDSVGVQYKGNSTFDTNSVKKPLNIKLDYIKNQDYEGYYTFKMSNGKNEPSFVREIIAYEIARKYMDASLCNYAQVYIDGNYLGLYDNVESVNKKFVGEKYYSNEDNSLFKCDPASFGAPPIPGCANSYNCSFLYLGLDSNCYTIPYDMKSDYGLEALRQLTLEIQNNPSTIESHLDIDRLIWMSAYNNVLVNLDSYLGKPKHNFYTFKDDNQRWDMILWDLNGCFGGFRQLSDSSGNASNTALQEIHPYDKQGDFKYPLINLILNNPTYKRMYMAHYRTIFEENILNDWYFNQGTAYQNFITAAFQADPNAFYPYTAFTSNLTSTVMQGNKIGIQELMAARKTYLQNNSEVQKAPPVLTNIIAPSFISPNTGLTITADVTNPLNVILGYRHSVKDVFAKVPMFDDGLHNDGASGDGVYGAMITSQISDIQYYVYAENIDAGIFSPVRAEHEYHTIAVAGDVVINELLAVNNTVQVDQNGEYDDWIELYNNTSNPISLDGYYLSDETANKTKWKFPNGTTINANDFLIIWADKDTTQTGLHANFKLSSSGESIYLSDSNSVLMDETTYGFQTADITWGRYPNGTGSFYQLNPTYNANNSNPIGIIEEIVENDEVLIYPNPANDQFTIQFTENDVKDVLIYDMIGKEVYSTKVESNKTIRINNLPSGLYLVIIDNKTVKKLVINR